MGNHHSHRSENGSGHSTPNSNGSSSRKNTVSRKFSVSSSASNKEKEPETQQVQQAPPCNQLPATEKLAKILLDKAHEEEGINGVSLNIFAKYLFPRYTVLAEKLFNYFHRQSKSKNAYISGAAFRQQCEKYLGLLDDESVRDITVRMFAEPDDSEEGSEVITTDSLRALLMCAYHVSMDHYSEGPQMCLSISKTLGAVVKSCFHGKTKLSCSFVAHWMEANCPRLLFPLHRYVVHTLATAYRALEDGILLAASVPKEKSSMDKGLELATPVLEQAPPFDNKSRHHHMLNMSMSWLLAGALPPVYSRPQRTHSPSNSSTGLASSAFLSKLLCAVPSHWLILYDSNEHGLGANRFIHHVLGYKGPTLILIRSEGAMFCIASPNEWKESHLYWGGEDAAVIQLLPNFQLLEKGSKMLYLNLTVRGYPQGLRAGKDPRAPIISIDGGFEKMEFQKIPYNVDAIEAWGCGDPVTRETQLDIKRWEVKEAERQRCVKLSAADWLDHPDRYLLELAGRPVYHQNQNQTG